MQKNGNILTSLGQRIREIRKSKGYSQKSLAKILELNRIASISDYENDKLEPNITKIRKIAELDNISLDWLLTGEGPKHLGNFQEQQASPAPSQADPLERALLEMFRGLSAKGKGDLLGDAEELKIQELRARAKAV